MQHKNWQINASRTLQTLLLILSEYKRYRQRDKL